MATFYGMVRGNRNEATRTGSKVSGFKSTCQSYDGSVITEMNYVDDKLMIQISLADNSSCSSLGSKSVFYGTFEELKKVFEENK